MAIHFGPAGPVTDDRSKTLHEGMPVLDHTKLAVLEELIGGAKCAAALRKFKAELAIRTAAIGASTTQPIDKAKHAHKLVGIAGIFGLEELCDKSRSLMTAVHHKSGDLQPYVESLLRAAERAAEEIKPLGEE
jgi:hypothetical protein